MLRRLFRGPVSHSENILLLLIICAIMVDVITASRFITDDAIRRENKELANRLYFSHWRGPPAAGEG